MISPTLYFSLEHNFRSQARTRMEKQIFLRIALGIVLKDIFTSKCNSGLNWLNWRFQISSAMQARQTRHIARILVPGGGGEYQKEKDGSRVSRASYCCFAGGVADARDHGPREAPPLKHSTCAQNPTSYSG